MTDVNGAREIIIEGENGTIISSKSVDALLYDALKRMLVLITVMLLQRMPAC